MHEREFDSLVRTHARAVHAYARALTRDRWRAEDVVQETFLRAWKYQDSYSNRGSFEGWLLRICRNCVIDQAAREARQVRSVDEREIHVEPDHASEIHELLDRLPLPQREVVLLCRFLGYEYEAAALILDVPVGTVRSRLNRAREALEVLLCEAQGKARPA
jgi:RNA polymerase sigma-70 factor (ECF subfamily)